jgi:hypothetical protein
MVFHMLSKFPLPKTPQAPDAPGVLICPCIRQWA